MDTKDASLYSRFWKETPYQKITSGSSSDDPKSSFTVATFNTLARGLISGPSDISPFAKDKNPKRDDYYGGFTTVQNPEVVLDFDSVRKWRLLHVLLGGGLLTDEDGSEIAECDYPKQPAFDILALEEVDEYYSFFRPMLVNGDGIENQSFESSIMGNRHVNCYEGVFQPKPYSPCIPLGFYSDGIALMWNREKFLTLARPSSLENVDGANDEVPWIEKDSYLGGRYWYFSS
mmetsp:Transcript_15189/g.32960  ORF Transcript_15189/g.32960 Transcript_15189/m.32960 type:complete len:232 (-) Transcript_15189:139-834(-)